MSTLNELREAAIKEARNINKYATAAEKAKLDASAVDEHSRSACIYGLMTGHCNSKRAEYLINKCCIGTSRSIRKYGRFSLSMSRFTEVKVDRQWTSLGVRSRWSALELYIVRSPAAIPELVNIIKS